jgi:hypothetical protein
LEFQAPLADKANDSDPPKTYKAEIMSMKDTPRLDITRPLIKINSKMPRSAFTPAIPFHPIKSVERMPPQCLVQALAFLTALILADGPKPAKWNMRQPERRY